MKNLIATTSFLLIFIFGLNAQNIVYSPKNGKTSVSSITNELKIEKRVEDSNIKSTKQSVAASLATILPSVIETGVTIVKSELKKREESFSAEYKVKSSESGFWKNKNKLALPELHYTKIISNRDTAITFVLKPEQSEDGLAFRYKIYSLVVNKSEARVNKKYSTINLKIDVKLIGFVQEDKKYSKSDLGQNAITIEGVSFSELVRGEYYSGWFPILPQIETPNPNGNYEIELTIKEANPNVLKTQKISKFFEDNGEKIQETSKLIIENVFKEDDSKNDKNSTEDTKEGDSEKK